MIGLCSAQWIWASAANVGRMAQAPDQACRAQVDECAGALIRAASRAEEDLASALPPRKRSYLFGPLGPAAARTIMWLLPELQVCRAHVHAFSSAVLACPCVQTLSEEEDPLRKGSQDMQGWSHCVALLIGTSGSVHDAVSGAHESTSHMVTCAARGAQEINQHGVARMCRLLAVLQPGLSSLGAAGGAFRPEAARAFEKARAYYGLLTLPPEALLKAAADRPDRFTAPEYLALLQV